MFPLTLRREIIALLLVKAVLLFAIYQFFFAHFPRAEPDGGATRAHILQTGGH